MKSLKRKISHLRLLPISTFLPLLFWPATASYLYVIPPHGLLSFIIFYLLTSGALFFTLHLFFSRLRSIILTGSIVIILLLRQFHQATPLHIGILIGTILMGTRVAKILKQKTTKKKIPSPENPLPPLPPNSLVRPLPFE